MIKYITITNSRELFDAMIKFALVFVKSEYETLRRRGARVWCS